jgi:hypothetical protein
MDPKPPSQQHPPLINAPRHRLLKIEHRSDLCANLENVEYREGRLFPSQPEDWIWGAPDSIFIIGKRCSDDPYSYETIGTGFYVSPFGIFLTAKHCLFSDTGEFINDLIAISPHPRKNTIDIMVRNISYAIGNPVGDLALGHVEPLYWSSQHQDYAPKHVFGDNQLGQDLYNNILTLSMMSPIVGDSVISFSYPRSKYNRETQGIEEACLRIQLIASGGLVTAVYPGGRDRMFLPGPCFETNL